MLKRNQDLPSAYVVYRRSQRCLYCGRTHDFTELYAKHIVYGDNKKPNGTHSIRIPQFSYNLPVETTQAHSTIPYCHDCIGTTNLNHLPTPVVPHEESVPLTMQGSARDTKPKSPAKPRVTVTLDDI